VRVYTMCAGRFLTAHGLENVFRARVAHTRERRTNTRGRPIFVVYSKPKPSRTNVTQQKSEFFTEKRKKILKTFTSLSRDIRLTRERYYYWLDASLARRCTGVGPLRVLALWAGMGGKGLSAQFAYLCWGKIVTLFPTIR